MPDAAAVIDWYIRGARQEALWAMSRPFESAEE